MTMAEEKSPRTPSEFLDKLSEFFGATGEDSLDELRDRLRAEGVDPDTLIARVRELVGTRSRTIQLQWQAKARQERLEASERLKGLTASLAGTREQVLDRIRGLLAGGPAAQQAQLQAYFRNFEGMSDRDLASVLEDLERVKRLETGASDDRQ